MADFAENTLLRMFLPIHLEDDEPLWERVELGEYSTENSSTKLLVHFVNVLVLSEIYSKQLRVTSGCIRAPDRATRP